MGKMELFSATKTRGKWSYVGWAACLVMLVDLAIINWASPQGAIRQAQGLKGLLQAGEGMSEAQLANPFVCLRGAGDIHKARAAVQNLSDAYLQGVGLCLAGERNAGLAKLEQARGEDEAAVQLAMGRNAENEQAQVQALLDLDLPNGELVPLLQSLSSMPQMDPYPILRILATRGNDQILTWQRWLEGSSRLELTANWQAAIDWIKEGISLAPRNLQGSLFERVGWIYQIRTDGPDYQAALENYNKALDIGGWLYTWDEANTHLYRGEVYRVLRDEYGPEKALEEIEISLRLLPGNYWALLEIGHIYLYDLNDLNQAEEYYQQAVVSDSTLPYAYYYMGELYLARGDKASAAEWYRQALVQQPDFQPAIDRLSELSSP
jgi:tetratricopeptide (TPR) repeat protein